MAIHPPVVRRPLPPPGRPQDSLSWADIADRQEAELAVEAAALGVTASVTGVAFPFVIGGTCDGRAFYLRERHGSYRVTMATDEDPGLAPWTSDPSAPSIDVAGGSAGELCGADGDVSAALALRIAVDAVRTTLARAGCAHTGTTGPYCPTCGVRRAEAERWRLG